MGRREGSDGSDSDSDEASVVGFFGGVDFDNLWRLWVLMTMGRWARFGLV